MNVRNLKKFGKSYQNCIKSREYFKKILNYIEKNFMVAVETI